MLRSRRLIAALLSASMIFTVLPSAVFADDETTEPDAVVEQQEEAEEEQVPDEIPEEPEEVPAEEPDAAHGEDGDTDTGEIAFPDVEEEAGTIDLDLEDSAVLFEGYADSVFSAQIDPAGGMVDGRVTTGSSLEPDEKAFYDILVDRMAEVAKGNVDSGIIVIDGTELGLKTEYTPQEFGYDSFIVNGSSANASAALMQLYNQVKFDDLTSLFYSLAYDHPYEYYWVASQVYTSVSRGFNGGYVYSNVIYPKITFTFAFKVSPNYREYPDYVAPDENDFYPMEFAINTERTGAVQHAVENAMSIVDQASGMTDYYKLLYYKDAICDMVSYDHAASADAENYPDRDVWALVYAFDGDPTTNIVCEGYAEAFQYLCELSSFDDTCVYSVTGTMNGGTGSGPHKWNIARIGGVNYLVDVTNSDSGSVGQGGQLFLKKASGSVSSGYTVYGVKFVYDGYTRMMYSDEELMLSSTDYSVPSQITIGDKISISGMSMTLGSTIKANLFVWLNPSVTLNNTDKMYVTVSGGERTEYVIKNLTKEGGDYFVPIELTAKEMASDISVYFVLGGSTSQTKTISVKKYANVLLSSANTSEIASAMLNYGAYTQSYFGYNTSTPANAGIVDNVPSSNPDLSSYENSVSAASGMDLSFYGSSLILKNDTRMKLYFTGGTISEVQYSGPKTVDYTVGGNTIIIKGITAKELSNSYTLTITDNTGKVMTLTVNPLAYGNKVLRMTGSGNEGLRNLIKALYLYHVEAKEYGA
ncbi:MAG: hypothetical protein IKE53_04805 [Clostridiales bacterium]|nr:hypothetical protein [Clostridiales bacterium]